MKLFFGACVLIAGMALSGMACAVGMGGISVSSALGEPLKAEIDLAGIANASKGGTLTVRLASPDVFKVAGLVYPSSLPTLKFAVESHPNGEPYLMITSASPVNDPFVTLLVELNWSSGRLLREYTFLLDPPGYRPEQPAAAKVAPMAPVETAKTGNVSAEPENTGSSSGIVNTPISPGAASVRKPVAAVRKPVASGRISSGRISSGAITVKRGDTLSKIARQVIKSSDISDISLERMLLALYRANADAFDGRNMNRLTVGKILHLPSSSEIGKTTQAEAIEEIHAQAADWNAYRQKLAAASTTAKEPAINQEISGKISTRVAENAPSVKAPMKEVVRLSKGMAPGDKSVAGSSPAAMQDKMNGLQEELIAKDEQLQDSNKRIAMLDKNIKEMQHLLELKSQTMASAKQTAKPVPAAPNAVPPPNTSAKPAPSAPLNDKEAQKTKPAAKPAPAVPKVEPAPSMMDEIASEPLYLAGIAVVVLLLLGGGFMLVRRNRYRTKTWGKVEYNIAEPVAPAATLGPAAQPQPISAAGTADKDVDPISEADLFLNFGRDTQAEEILKYALENDPANLPILLKLLSIYLARKDSKAFYAIAQQVRDSGDAAAWSQAAEMGRKLEPGNPFYGGEEVSGKESVVPEPEMVKQEAKAMGLDFDLASESKQPGTGADSVFEFDKPKPDNLTTLDFDLGVDYMKTGGEIKSNPDDRTSTFATVDNEPTAQFETQHGFIDVTSDSLPFHAADVEKPGTGNKAGQENEEFIDVSSKSLPLQGADAGKQGIGGKAERAVKEFIDVSSKSLPLQGADAGKPGIGGKAEHALEDFIDVSSKSMSLPLSGVEVKKPTAAGTVKSGVEDFIDVTSTSFPLLNIDVDKPGAAGNAKPAVQDFIDVTSSSFPLQNVDVAETGGKTAPAPAEFFDVTSEPLPLNADAGKSKTGGMAAPVQLEGLNFHGISLDLDEPDAAVAETEVKDAHWNDVAVKIDLAKAYQEMGDAAGAQELLKEVMDEGDVKQRAAARGMLEQLAV